MLNAIANNILNAVANSRRTILVLSPRYMESDFTRFEYQEAHAAMLRLQHKVIPLLLEDVSQQKHLMDRTLASILKSITYIEWPGDGSEGDLEKFWTRLELSLPKKRSDSSSPSSSYPVLSFSDSQFSINDSVLIENGGTGDTKGATLTADVKGNNNTISRFGSDSENNVPGPDENSLNDSKFRKRELKTFFKVPADERFTKIYIKGKASE